MLILFRFYCIYTQQKTRMAFKTPLVISNSLLSLGRFRRHREADLELEEERDGQSERRHEHESDNGR